MKRRFRCAQFYLAGDPAEPVQCEKPHRHPGRHKAHTATNAEQRWNDSQSAREYDSERSA